MLTIKSHPDRVTLLLEGEFDVAAMPAIKKAVSTALDTVDGRPVEFDLAGVTFIDSSGFGALIAAREQCANQGTTLLITGVSDRVRRTFEISGLGSLLDPAGPAG